MQCKRLWLYQEHVRITPMVKGMQGQRFKPASCTVYLTCNPIRTIPYHRTQGSHKWFLYSYISQNVVLQVGFVNRSLESQRLLLSKFCIANGNDPKPQRYKPKGTI